MECILFVLALGVVALGVTSQSLTVFEINNMNNFNTMRELFMNGTLEDVVELNCDLDFHKSTFVPVGQTAFGNSSSPFNRTFHGNGHTIKNLVISAPNFGNKNHDAGFFHSLQNAEVSDLYFDETCSFRGTWAGALATQIGDSSHNVVIKNVSNAGTVVGAAVGGGIVGFVSDTNTAEVRFEGCNNEGKVSLAPPRVYYFCAVGGIVGYIRCNATLIDCHNAGSVYAETHHNPTEDINAGGIVGQFTMTSNNTISVKSCSNHASVQAHGSNPAEAIVSSGGIIGSVYVINTAKVNEVIHECMNNGSVLASSENGSSVYAAGINGLVKNKEETGSVELNMTKCHNAGNVNASSPSTQPGVTSAGLVVGEGEPKRMNVNDCANEGTITSSDKANGLINTGNVSRSINTGSVNGGKETYGIAESVGSIDETINAGDVICSPSTTCKCGVKTVLNNYGTLQYKESGGCGQKRGRVMTSDAQGMLMIGDDIYLADYLNSKGMVQDGRLWSRDMKIGYCLTIATCDSGIERNETRGYIVVKEDESIKEAIEREGREYDILVDNSKYVMMIDGNVMNCDTTIHGNNTISICKFHACYNSQCDIVSGKCVEERISGYEEKEKEANKCYEVACDGSRWIVTKRQEASEWEHQTNESIEYVCDNSSGLLMIPMTKGWGVDIVVDNETEMDEEEIIEQLMMILGIDERNAMSIGIQTNDNGEIRITLYFENETAANNMYDTANQFRSSCNSDTNTNTNPRTDNQGTQL